MEPRMHMGYPEFLRVAAYFHQDADLTYGSFQELLAGAFRGLTEQEKANLASFLSTAVSAFDDAQLQHLWSTSGAEIHLTTAEQLRAFLGGMQTMLHKG